MKVVQFPERDLSNVPQTLRALADSIEQGKFGEAFHCAWVVDCGDGDIAVGLAGQTPAPGPLTHFLLALGMRKLESISE